MDEIFLAHLDVCTGRAIALPTGSELALGLAKCLSFYVEVFFI